MNCISYVPSAYLLSQSRHVIMRNSLYRFYTSASKQGLIKCYNSTRTNCAKLSFIAPRVQYFSSVTKRARASKKAKVVDPCPVTDRENEAFYVVKKEDLIGIYKRSSDSQAQISSSICDPSVLVYKGYDLCEEAETFLASKGLKNAIYTLKASDLKDEILGNLIPLKSCIIEFDGASKGNPGKAGAGAIIRTEDGRVIAKLCEGLGDTTNNVAEYKALILGLKYAVDKEFNNVQVMGDSNLIVKQVRGDWKSRNENMKDLCKKVEELKKNFESFEIRHVRRELNCDADDQANIGAGLPDGEIQVESSIPC